METGMVKWHDKVTSNLDWSRDLNDTYLGIQNAIAMMKVK